MAAINGNDLPSPIAALGGTEPGALSFMLSKEGYVNDEVAGPWLPRHAARPARSDRHTFVHAICALSSRGVQPDRVCVAVAGVDRLRLGHRSPGVSQSNTRSMTPKASDMR